MYQRMQSSFIAAGFSTDVCRYSLLDNAIENRFEPYRALSDAMEFSPEPYLIFCHQDVLLDRDHGITQLQHCIAELDSTNPRWSVAGNAGGTDTLRSAIKITDPHGIWSVGKFPKAVQSLDENFLLLKTKSNIRCSPELRGFHFYGTDICLNARRRRRACYVIDFHLTHLSRGAGGQGYEECRIALCNHWNNRFIFRYVKTTCTLLFLSRFALLRSRFGNSSRLRAMQTSPRWHTALVIARRLFTDHLVP